MSSSSTTLMFFIGAPRQAVLAAAYGGGVVLALEEGVFIASPKSLSELATQLVFLGKWQDLLERLVWSYGVAHLQMYVAWIRLAVWCSQKHLLQSFLGFVHWQVRPPGGGVSLCCRGLVPVKWGGTGVHPKSPSGGATAVLRRPRKPNLARGPRVLVHLGRH